MPVSDPCDGSGSAAPRNGFRLDGRGFAGTIVDLDSARTVARLVEHYLPEGITSFDYISDDVEIGRGSGVWGAVDVRLQFTGLYGAGTFPWRNLAAGSQGSGLVLTIVRGGDTVRLRSISGVTTMTIYGGIGHSPIRGRYCGLMCGDAGDTVTVRGGIFGYKE